MLRTLPVGRSEADDASGGFTLLEVICVVAIIGLIAAVLLPTFPRGTSQPQLKAYAVEVASLLTADRTEAIRGEVEVTTDVDAAGHFVRSRSQQRTIRLPDDVDVAATLAERCNGRMSGGGIVFFPSGLSCGGVVSLARSGVRYEVQVNWMTGGVKLVEHNNPS